LQLSFLSLFRQLDLDTGPHPMGNVGSADEGVGETPGHGSSTVTPTSDEHSPHQEIVTASATVAEVQSGRVATYSKREHLVAEF